MSETTHAAFSLGQLFISNEFLTDAKYPSVYFDFLLVVKLVEDGKIAVLMSSLGRKFFTVTVGSRGYQNLINRYQCIELHHT